MSESLRPPSPPLPRRRGKGKAASAQFAPTASTSEPVTTVKTSEPQKRKRATVDTNRPPPRKRARKTLAPAHLAYSRYRDALDAGRVRYLQVDPRTWVAEICSLDDESVVGLGGLDGWAVIRRELDANASVSYHCSCRDYVSVKECVHSAVLTSPNRPNFEPLTKCDNFPAILFHRIEATATRPAYHLFITYSEGHTRELVSHFGRSSKAGEWMCRKHRGSSCAHIEAARKTGGLGLSLDGTDVPGDEDKERVTHDAARQKQENVDSKSEKDREDERCVSHLPIGPPIWARLTTDKLDSPPVLDDLPDVLPLGEHARCRCGGAPRPSSPIEVESCVVYGDRRPSLHQIELRACASCPRKCGPDLRDFGLFNFSNDTIFSISLFESFQSCMSTSETPLSAFRQTVSHTYATFSAYNFVGDKLFRLAYYGFCRLQMLSGSYVCSSCGLWPEVILMDGVSAGYGNEFVTSTILPPTTVLPDSPTRRDVRPPRNPTSIVTSRELRKRAQEEVRRLLNRDKASPSKDDDVGTDVDDDDVSLARKKTKKQSTTRRRSQLPKIRQGPRPDVELLAKQLGEENEALGVIFGAHVVGKPALRVEDEIRYLELLEQVLAYESVLQFAPSTSWPLLVLISKTGDVEALEALLPLVPALAFVGQVELRVFGTLSAPFRNMVGFVLDRAATVLSELPKHELSDCDLPEPLEEDWRETGCFYGRPRVRNRPRYPNMENDGRQERGKVTTEGTNIGCSKFYEEYGKRGLTGGLMVAWCPHGVCIGFHVIPAGEGRNDVFSALFCYWPKPPKVVIYDFACALAPYCMTREPELFGDTLFVIDKFHDEGHTRCSPACFLATYSEWRRDLRGVNSSVGESGNAGIARIRKTVSYMTQRHAVDHVYTFLAFWNRARIRELEAKNNELSPRKHLKKEKRR